MTTRGILSDRISALQLPLSHSGGIRSHPLINIAIIMKKLPIRFRW
jgi:hypothetical protein